MRAWVKWWIPILVGLSVGVLAYPPWRFTKHVGAYTNIGGAWRLTHTRTQAGFAGFAPVDSPPSKMFENRMGKGPAPLFGPHVFQSLSYTCVYSIDWGIVLLFEAVAIFVVSVAAYESKKLEPKVAAASAD